MTSETARQNYESALEAAQTGSKEPSEVLQLLRRALKAGSADAEYALGTWYLFGTNVRKDVRRGLRMIESAARRNVARACFDIAIGYETGKAGRTDLELAAIFYMKGALLGDHDSVLELARCYQFGIGLSTDLRLATLCYDVAKHFGVQDEPGPGELESNHVHETPELHPE